MNKIALKVCGMNHNVAEVAALKPDYLGFIFFDGSPRNFKGTIPAVPDSTRKVGVFVNASVSEILETKRQHGLDIVQLHGEESPEFCQSLNVKGVQIWKVFPVGKTFDFDALVPFEPFISHFLFDTKGLKRGGNGVLFDWDILKAYPSEKPIVLSGGIAPGSVPAINELKESKIPLAVVDINSRFEISPGLKDVNAIKRFYDELQR